ncbi:hypothetical protein ACSBLW_16385 [Thioclava sp. FR2]|uniref:hypothetical protein n=1 Tax=Thioclava sp. FR2 TaxID=3445780 RepID=UPI003EBD798F
MAVVQAATALRNLAYTIAVIAGAWTVSSLGYFGLEPVLQAEVGYNDAPVAYAFYYGLWAAAVFAVFRKNFQAVGDLSLTPLRVAVLALMALCFAGFALFVLPRLPTMEWTRSQDPVEFFWANSWYFLPKAVEILFQQVLIAALVFALSDLGLKTWKVALLVALLFGGFHATLAFSYPNPLYVFRYSVAATLFGALVPWILLRQRHGFLITLSIHAGYYVIDSIAIHYAFAAS